MKVLFLQNVWSTQDQKTFEAGTEAEVSFSDEVIEALLTARAIEIIPAKRKPEPKVEGPVQSEE